MLGKEASSLHTRRKSLVTQMGQLVGVLRSLRTQDAQFLTENSETGAKRQKLDADVRELREALADVETAQNARRGKLEGLEARLAVLSAAQKQAAAEPTEEAMIEGAVGTIFDGLRGPPGYRIARKAEVTVMMWKDNQVEINRAFAAGQLDDSQVNKVVADAKKFFLSKSPTTSSSQDVKTP